MGFGSPVTHSCRKLTVAFAERTPQMEVEVFSTVAAVVRGAPRESTADKLVDWGCAMCFFEIQTQSYLSICTLKISGMSWRAIGPERTQSHSLTAIQTVETAPLGVRGIHTILDWRPNSETSDGRGGSG